MLKHLPNALTLLRLVLAPVIAWLAWRGGDIAGFGEIFPEVYDLSTPSYFETELGNYTFAAALFIIAALTDLFDGMAARALDAHSKFGRLIDPIADKALVGLPLFAIVLAEWGARFQTPYLVPATLAVTVIVVRDVSMTVIRLSAPDGEGAPVSSLAKIKTALELVVVGAFLIAPVVKQYIGPAVNEAGDGALIAFWRINDYLQSAWLALLVLAAALSAYTAFQYLRPRKR